MAIVKSNVRQPYLEKLDLPDEQFALADYQLPQLSDIDGGDVEFIVDVDLDDLSVFFADKNMPYYTEEVDDQHSVLVDAKSNNIMGVVLHHFLSETIKNHSSLVPILRHATIIAGSTVEEFDDGPGESGSTKTGIKSRLESWVNTRVRREERQEAFASLASLIGIY